MKIRSALFVSSADQLKQCPADKRPEFAFIGRSNVGKSSLINMLTGIKGLAKTSSTPGKTQLINHFIINDSWFLVDLPGYGFAKVSQTEREKWQKRLHEYLLKRENLFFVFVLIDSRLEPQANDLDMIHFLGKNGIPMGIIFTKTDKPKPRQLDTNIELLQKELKKNWKELPIMFISSAESNQGKDEILSFIEPYV